MRLSSFQDLLCWCHFPKWVFAEGRSTRSQWCLEKVQGPIWCQRIIWWWRAFPRMPKTMNFNHPTIWWDRKLETLGLFRRRISSRSVLSCQNLLNRHMGQKALQKYQFSRKLRSSQFPGKYVLLVVIFQNGVSPKAVQPEAPGFRGDPKANLEVFCHEATFQFTVKCWKVDFPMPCKTKSC